MLLTEPDSVSADYLAMVLEKGGYHVDTAHDAGATRELLGRWKYAAWLLTRRLAGGVDALGLLAEMKPRLQKTAVVMLAGLTSDEAGVPEPQRQGIADWLSKSDSRARILEVVDHATGRVTS